jgi:hypothetical protein
MLGSVVPILLAMTSLPSEKAFGNECPSHFMPRDESEDIYVQSDLFALWSALYGLEFGRAPFAGEEEEEKKIMSGLEVRSFPWSRS